MLKLFLIGLLLVTHSLCAPVAEEKDDDDDLSWDVDTSLDDDSTSNKGPSTEAPIPVYTPPETHIQKIPRRKTPKSSDEVMPEMKVEPVATKEEDFNFDSEPAKEPEKPQETEKPELTNIQMTLPEVKIDEEPAEISTEAPAKGESKNNDDAQKPVETQKSLLLVEPIITTEIPTDAEPATTIIISVKETEQPETQTEIVENTTTVLETMTTTKE